MGRKKRLVNNVVLTGIADKGFAVGRAEDGEVLFVSGGVPGDVVDVLVLRKKKSYSQGIVKNVIQHSEFRTEPFCEHFADCGGCKWQELEYDHQVKYKQINVVNAMTRLAKLPEELIEPIVGSEVTRAYRNKLEYSFSNRRYIPQAEVDARKGEVIPQEPALGFHVSGGWDKILDVRKCHLQDDLSNEIRNFVKEFCVEHDYSFYHPRNHEGLMRNIIVRNTLEGDWMVVVIFLEDDRPRVTTLMDALKDNFPQITSLNYVVNPKLNDTIYDLDIHTYNGLPYMVEKLRDVKYQIGPKSFFQTNSAQAIQLFDAVVEFAEFDGGENVYDLYTGIGSIALYIADKVKHVTGIEEVEAAIEDAKVNARFNAIDNTTFYAGDVKDILTEEFAKKHGKPDIVITDPPRAGMHQNVCETLLELEAEKIVYVSCNPSTQARDLTILGSKYEVIRIRAVDMFPHTHHIENVALLRLKKDLI